MGPLYFAISRLWEAQLWAPCTLPSLVFGRHNCGPPTLAVSGLWAAQLWAPCTFPSLVLGLLSLFQFHFWNSPSGSVRSPLTLHSSKAIRICIRHTNLCRRPSCKNKHLVKDLFLTLAHTCGTICLKHAATVIRPPLSKPPSRRTCSINIF